MNPQNLTRPLRIAVVIPCYQGSEKILDVIGRIPDIVTRIYCVDDACTEATGDVVSRECRDERIKVIFHEENMGVGGAMVTGYRAALADRMDIVVKLDSDGQMDPALIPRFIHPILEGKADYTKGNRFFRLEDLRSMPKLRLAGNAILSFMNKLSSGYWQIFDPNNGYTALHAKVLAMLPLDKIHKGYFFESDMLFRLNTVRAMVVDIPIPAVYENETSNLKIRKEIFVFAFKHAGNFCKRIFYNYFLRDFSIASLELVTGLVLFLFGIIFGTYSWISSYEQGIAASSGTVMLAALPVIIGLQLLLSAMNYDIENTPVTALHPLLDDE